MDEPRLTGRRVLITGGAGFIGSHLARTLDAANEVVVLDDFSVGSRRRCPAGSTVVEGDICDAEVLERAVREVDVIFHQAAVVSVDRTVESPRQTTATNVDGTLAVLERARKEDIRVVLASSAAVYGDPDRVPIPESAPLEPESPYGLQKLTADRFGRLYAELYDLPVVALRYFNVYGPGQRGPYSGVISTFLQQAAHGHPLTVEGDGDQTRDFVHVTDVVRANLLAATTEHVGRAFNVATGVRTSITDLAETVRSVLDASVPVVYESPRSGDIRHSCGDVTTAATDLGFEARRSLEDGLAALVTRTDSQARLGATDR